MAALAAYPQLHLIFTRGREWQGAYAFFYSDEPAYAAYLNALIEGRPRLSDPYSGADDAPDAPLAESLFSIQFAPAYLLALPARAAGLDAATVFMLLPPLVAFAVSLLIFRLAAHVTRGEGAAAACVPLVLALGAAVSGQGFVKELFGDRSAYIFLPFLRRYVPGVPLVAFFLFCLFLWRALYAGDRRARTLYSLAAGAAFAFTVYGYFYHWTAAAALALCLAPLHFFARPRDRRGALAVFAVVGLCALASLVPYFFLLARRAPTMDAAQALLHTRRPDLLRGVLLAAALALGLVVYGARRGLIEWRARAPLFTSALALSVFAVFNQQVLTGRSLQPMHYEQYVGNYVALLALALALALLRQGRARLRQAGARQGAPRAWLPVALAALLWGACETVWTTHRYAPRNVAHDEWGAVTGRLRELSRQDFAHGAIATPRVAVFTPDPYRADDIPAATPLAVLWAPHLFVFSGTSPGENKERFFQFLYYSGVAPAEFADGGRDDGFLQYAIFGWERANPRLTAEHRPVTPEEIKAEQQNYALYVERLARGPAPQPALAYAVLPAERPFNTANLDRHYTREEAGRAGRHVIYRLRPRA